MRNFKPMLASAFEGELSELHYPLLASPKLDGIRAVIVNGKALTRSLKPVPNRFVREYLEALPLDGLDGELMVEGNFQDVTSAIMRHEGEPAFTFNVFDYFSRTLGFKERLSYVRDVVREVGDPRIALVQHVNIYKPRELEGFEEDCLATGFEGVMLRDPEGPYKHGRATAREGWLLKLKRFTDAEARVVGFEERMHNGNAAFTSELGRTKRSSAQAGKSGTDTLGAFVLQRPDEKRVCANCQGSGTTHYTEQCDECFGTGALTFRCGTGMSESQRLHFWNNRSGFLGKLLKFKYQAHGTKDAPRCPVFLGFRDERDL